MFPLYWLTSPESWPHITRLPVTPEWPFQVSSLTKDTVFVLHHRPEFTSLAGVSKQEYLYTAQKSNSHYAPQPYTNQSVFKSLLNCTSETSLSCNATGREFQRRGPATEKLLSPRRVRVLIVAHVETMTCLTANPGSQHTVLQGFYYFAEFIFPDFSKQNE